MELTNFVESNTRSAVSLPMTAAYEDLWPTLTSTLILVTYGSGGCQACWVSSVPALYVVLCWARTTAIVALTVSTENGIISKTYFHCHFHTHHIILAPATKLSAFPPLVFSHRSTTKLRFSPPVVLKCDFGLLQIPLTARQCSSTWVKSTPRAGVE